MSCINIRSSKFNVHTYSYDFILSNTLYVFTCIPDNYYRYMKISFNFLSLLPPAYNIIMRRLFSTYTQVYKIFYIGN